MSACMNDDFRERYVERAWQNSRFSMQSTAAFQHNRFLKILSANMK